MLIRYWSNTYTSDWYQIDINQGVFPIWANISWHRRRVFLLTLWVHDQLYGNGQLLTKELTVRGLQIDIFSARLILLKIKKDHHQLRPSPGIILCMHSANERCYNLTLPSIGWAHAQNDPYWPHSHHDPQEWTKANSLSPHVPVDKMAATL